MAASQLNLVIASTSRRRLLSTLMPTAISPMQCPFSRFTSLINSKFLLPKSLGRKNIMSSKNYFLQRSFATSRQKRAAAAAAQTSTTKKNDLNDQEKISMERITASSPSIHGKRPGQTPFSPPATKTYQISSRQSHSNMNVLKSSLDSFSNNEQRLRMTNPNNPQPMPLIIPLSASEIKQQSDTDIHGNPKHKSYESTIDFNTDNNPLRELLLKEGIIPARPRPIIEPSSSRTGASVNTDSNFEIEPPQIPPPDPSGVSHANPEDILDLSSMYDPSIHLPDKPNFNTPSNRKKYEEGTPLTDELIAYIGVRGPITVAEFMRRVLRDGRYGYYTNKGSRSGKKLKGVVSEDGVSQEVDIDNDWDIEDDDNLESVSETRKMKISGGGEQIIGSGGDFITAPEVSQLFGESLLVWFLTQYQSLGNPSKIQFIEIGPGKGTLMCDILRSAIESFPDFASALTSGREKNDANTVDVGVHLVEVTNGMRARQKESLQNLATEENILDKEYSFQFVDDKQISTTHPEDEKSSEASNPQHETNQNTISFQWHNRLSSVPTHDSTTGIPIPTFVICQELADALPIHSFQKIEGGRWRERLVDVAVRDESEAKEAANEVHQAVIRRYANAESSSGNKSQGSTSSNVSAKFATETTTNRKIPRLRFVLPPDTTPALRTLLRVNRKGSPTDDDLQYKQTLDSLPVGSIIEASPETLLLAQDIADRIETCSGAALIIDYGEDGSSGGDTLRGFWKHTQVHPLSRPGEVDVTADVDFGAVREAVNRRVTLEESLKRRRWSVGNKSKLEGCDEEVVEAYEDVKTKAESNTFQPEAFGPITQGKFLASMGIVQRVEKYIEDDNTTDDQAYQLYSALERLMAPDQMGERYKVLALARKKDGLFPPPGF